jgi:hypothetical protein
MLVLSDTLTHTPSQDGHVLAIMASSTSMCLIVQAAILCSLLEFNNTAVVTL